MRFPLIVFDLDGTLVDSLPDIGWALNRALGEVGRPALPLSVVRTLIGEGVMRLAEKALAQDPGGSPPAAAGAARALGERTRRIYREQPCRESTVFPGMHEALAALSGTGHHLAVLTNKPGEVTRPLLQALELGGWFAEVVGDGDGYPPKPDPAGALALIQRLGARPEQTLIVGDGVPDLKLARATGAQVAAVGWGYNDREVLEALAPDFFLDRPADLLAIA